ncbi:MAG: hypothetical protein ACLP7P_07625 [Rhodomicrobium sp.]
MVTVKADVNADINVPGSIEASAWIAAIAANGAHIPRYSGAFLTAP